MILCSIHHDSVSLISIVSSVYLYVHSSFQYLILGFPLPLFILHETIFHWLASSVHEKATLNQNCIAK